MPVSGEHENYDFRIADFIYQPVFLYNKAAPLSRTFSRKLFGMACI